MLYTITIITRFGIPYYTCIYCRFRRLIIHLALAVLLAFHTVKTYTRNFDWESEQSIFSAGLRVNQRNAKLFNNVGHALESQAQYTEALEYFLAAVKYDFTRSYSLSYKIQYLYPFWFELL